MNSKFIEAIEEDDTTIIEGLLQHPRFLSDINRDIFTLEKLFKYGSVKILNFLISKGLDIYFRDKTERNILNNYASNINIKLAKLLINKGIDINNRGVDGSTPLMEAVRWRNYKLVDLLVKKGCNINVVNNYGKTALMEACYFTNLETVKFLIDHGASFKYINENNEDAFYYSYDNEDIFLYLYSNKMYNKELFPDILFLCIAFKQYYAIPYLLRHIKNINNISKNKKNLLEYCLNISGLKAVEEILPYLSYSDLILQLSEFKHFIHYKDEIMNVYNIYEKMKMVKAKERSDLLREELIAKYLSPQNIEKWALCLEYNSKSFDEIIEIM